MTDGVALDAQPVGRSNTAGAAVAGTVLDQARTYRDAADVPGQAGNRQHLPWRPCRDAQHGHPAAARRRHTQEDGQRFESSSSVIRATLRGIAKKHGRPQRRTASGTTRDTRRMVARCDSDLAGRCDRALLLLGFAAALRRSELVALEREDILFTLPGIRVTIPRPKTGHVAEGVTLNVLKGAVRETCPVLSCRPGSTALPSSMAHCSAW